MIGIATLNLISIQFLQCLNLGGRAHPIESLQPRTHGRFDVGDELFDLDLGSGRKVLRSIKLTQAEAHITETVYAVACAISSTDGADGPLPSHLLLGLAGENLVAELEACFRERLRKIEGCIVGNGERLPRLQNF